MNTPSTPHSDYFCLQEKYAPESQCFGCGPSNPKGLHIRSMAMMDSGDPTVTESPKDLVIAQWVAEPHHEAFPGVLNGGIIGALLDCHSNWSAAWHLMRQQRLEAPPCTVTAEFSIKLLRPTPTDGPILLEAEVIWSEGNRAKTKAVLKAQDKVCATCTGTFVAVPPGHPAHKRW